MTKRGSGRGFRGRTARAAGVSGLLGLVSPGFHLVASPLLERRRVTRKDDYPALLFGDPLLAVAAGVATWMAHDSPVMRSRFRWALVAAPSGLLFGAWQVRQEVADGLYTRAQATSPTKLWHQYVVYPVLGTIVPRAIIRGLSRARHNPVGAVVVVSATVVWSILVAESLTNDRVGHGTFDWGRWRRQGPLSEQSDPATG